VGFEPAKEKPLDDQQSTHSELDTDLMKILNTEGFELELAHGLILRVETLY
jgi:hypothetical protein